MRKKSLHPRKRKYIQLTFYSDIILYNVPTIFRHEKYSLDTKKVKNMILNYFACRESEVMDIIDHYYEETGTKRNTIITMIISHYLMIENPFDKKYQNYK